MSIYLYFLKIVSSAKNSTYVPFTSLDEVISEIIFLSPFEKSRHISFLSLKDLILNFSDNALTAFIPTPFNPTDFLNTSESYFPPVLILETQSSTFPRGIPLP